MKEYQIFICRHTLEWQVRINITSKETLFKSIL